MTSTILVTGATGNVGRELVSLLAVAPDCLVVAAVRNPTQTRAQFPESVRCVGFDFTNPATFADALQGVNRLFLVRPPAMADLHQITPALNAAKDVGVEQIVFLSIVGADRNPIVPHARIEGYLARLQIPAVCLRASFFMQNLNTTHCADIRDRERLFMPAGNGKTSCIDVRDIAAVAAQILTAPVAGDRLHARVLTGAVALTYFEVADIFTVVLGRSIAYTKPSIPIFIWQMLRQGYPLPFVLVMVGIYTTARWGLADVVTADVERSIGRAPIKMQQYVEDYRQYWQQPR